MLAMHAGASQLNYLASQSLEDLKLEFLGRVVTTTSLGVNPGLQTVRADDLLRSQMLHHQMVAHRIEGIFIPASGVRIGQTFVEFEVEYLKSKGLSGPEFIQVLRESRLVLRRR
jgi:hypothetical protein